MMKKLKAVSVPLHDAESLRRYLREHGLLREDARILKDGARVYFPLKTVPEPLGSYEIVVRSFEIKSAKPASYKDRLKIPEMLRQTLPTSYDVLGDIILIKIPKPLQGYLEEIGEALLDAQPHVRTVCAISPVSGELRVRDVCVIAGEDRTLTTHTEYGLSFMVDVRRTYFSPRLASERKRVTGQVRDGEVVVDMFAGVAPFSIMIARFAHPRIVYAIDKNTEAVDLAKRNVTLNHVLDLVEVVCADSKDVGEVVPVKADRIIMNLPFSAHRFFAAALSIAKDTCHIHYYDMLKEDEVATRVSALKTIAGDLSFVLSEVVVRPIKSYTPREFYIGLDITATKHADVA